MFSVTRRGFLAAASIPLAHSGAQAASIPIIDTHIHLFDPTRPQGVPWPKKTDAILYQPALPDRYRKIAMPLGITGAIAGARYARSRPRPGRTRALPPSADRLRQH